MESFSTTTASSSFFKSVSVVGAWWLSFLLIILRLIVSEENQIRVYLLILCISFLSSSSFTNLSSIFFLFSSNLSLSLSLTLSLALSLERQWLSVSAYGADILGAMSCRHCTTCTKTKGEAETSEAASLISYLKTFIGIHYGQLGKFSHLHFPLVYHPNFCVSFFCCLSPRCCVRGGGGGDK